jgi:pyruvate/2-oxoglutarate dehydrogenase complex dihydrolipoamide dehydrogenase (E3) component
VTPDASFDVVVVGAGPGGETAAGRLADAGLRTALVERELLGGECAYWACIPSKTLLRPAEVAAEARRAAGTEAPVQHFEEIARYRDFMIRELDDSGELAGYEKQGIVVVRGTARLDGPRHVVVGDRVLETERIIVATGSEPVVPPIDGLDATGYWTNRDATTLSSVPRSIAVLGGGPVGIELSQMLHRYGAEVHLIERGDRLLAREESRASELIADALRDEGIALHLNAEVESVAADGAQRAVTLAGADEPLRVERILVATSRRPRTAGLGLDSVDGLEHDESGIAIDEHCQAAPGVWAIGDVTGVMPFTHVAEYQARIVCADIAGEARAADYRAIPRVVFCDPEIAAVGMTRARAAEAGIDCAHAVVELGRSIARPWIQETEPRGELGVIVDRERRTLAGAWAAAPLASEWIHYAALAIKAEIPVATLIDTVAQFPTYTEAYLEALERANLNS